MAKKFKIAQNPTFKKEVSIPRIGADPVKIEFEFRYLARKELAKLYQKWQEETTKLIDANYENLIEITEAEIQLQVDQLKDILIGWDFDDEFNDEAISELVETSVHATRVVMDAYAETYAEVKLGN